MSFAPCRMARSIVIIACPPVPELPVIALPHTYISLQPGSAEALLFHYFRHKTCKFNIKEDQASVLTQQTLAALLEAFHLLQVFRASIHG